MSASTAIGMVSESLRNLLLGEMTVVPAAPVTVLAPDASGSARRVNLFLYKTAINAPLRNLDWRMKPGSSTQLVPAPLSIGLHYVMTALSPNDAITGEAPAHELLGDAMRVLHQFPVIPNGYLVAGLKQATEDIRIVLEPVDLHELSTLWSTFSQPYRLSAVYQVSVVQLDPSTKAERPLPKRVRSIGMPDVRGAFAPPDVATLSPASGPAGSVLTFYGSCLDGWKAYVTLSGQTLADGVAINGDTFTIALPGDAVTGFHELRVDVSHLFRKTFIFEVTS